MYSLNRLLFIGSFITTILILFAISCSDSTKSTPVYTLTTSAQPAEAGTVNPSSADAEEGNSVQITATPNEHWQFVRWAGDLTGSNQPTVFVYMDRDRDVQAVFEKVEYPLTVTIEGEGNVTQEVISQKVLENDYSHGSVIRLTAVPEFGWEFVEWTGDFTGTDINIDVPIDGPTEMGVVFRLLDFDLTVNIDGGGSVAQEVVVAKTTEYQFGTTVLLTAEPDFGWTFARWEGAEQSTDSQITVLIDSDKTITAVFNRLDFSLTVNIQGNGTVSQQVMPASTTQYPFETVIQLTAVPENNWQFNNWTGDLVSAESQVLVTLNNNKTVNAIFGPALTITTSSATNITQNSVSVGGTFFNQSGMQILDVGICLSAAPNVNLETSPNLDCKGVGVANGVYVLSYTELQPNTTYYYRSVVNYLLNGVSRHSFGSEQQFTTAQPLTLPTLGTVNVTSITANTAVSGGNVTSEGGATVTSRGVCWSTGQNPAIGSAACSSDGAGLGVFASTLSTLAPSTTYFVRAYASSAAGTNYGNQVSFTTIAGSTPPPSSPPPSTGQIQIAVLFLSSDFTFTSPVDIILNGQRYSYFGRAFSDPIWNVRVYDGSNETRARGHIITLNESLVSVNFDLAQVKSDGLSRGGFGNFNFKILKRHPETTLTNLNTDSGSINYWAGVTDETGTLQVFGDSNHPSPTFPYYEFGVTNADIGSSVSVANWNSTGKFVIVVGEVGNQ